MIDRGGRNSNEVVLFSGVDWWTVLLYVALTIIGFVAVFSASYVEGSENAFSFSHEYIKHLFWLGLSYFAGLIILLLDRSVWHKCAYIICGITIFILLLTFTPLGKSVNGARAWLGLGGFTLQPMEFVKVGISLTMARIMSVYGFSVQHVNDMIKALILLFIPMAIAVLQNDTGSGLVFCSFIFMFFREGLNYWICIPLIFLVALLILSFLLTPGVLLIALILIFTFCAGMLMRNRWKACINYIVSLFFCSTLLFILLVVILGKSLKEQGIFDLYPKEKKRWYVKVPVFSFNKIRGLDAYLSPEMKSTGEAIGYDDKLNRALYKALQASGMHLQNYGTVFATIADEDKAEALPLIRRFYKLGFNIQATAGTAKFLKENGIRTHVLGKISEGSNEVPEVLRQGHIAYIINTKDISTTNENNDGHQIRFLATENNVTIFTALDTVNVLLDVLEENTITISTIDA